MPAPAVPDAPAAALARNDPPAITETRTFAIDSGEVGRADDWIEIVGKQWGASQQTIFGARLCVAELMANVVEHGLAKPDSGRITVTLVRHDRAIGIEFLDPCARFDPTIISTPAPASSIELATIGGRGLMLVHAYAKEIAYRHDNDVNRTTLLIAR